MVLEERLCNWSARLGRSIVLQSVLKWKEPGSTADRNQKAISIDSLWDLVNIPARRTIDWRRETKEFWPLFPCIQEIVALSRTNNCFSDRLTPIYCWTHLLIFEGRRPYSFIALENLDLELLEETMTYYSNTKTLTLKWKARQGKSQRIVEQAFLRWDSLEPQCSRMDLFPSSSRRLSLWSPSCWVLVWHDRHAKSSVQALSFGLDFFTRRFTITCHVFWNISNFFDVSFPFIDNSCMIYKSTFVFLGPYIIMFGLHFPFDDTLKYPYFTS
jgi:hypothetical protein